MFMSMMNAMYYAEFFFFLGGGLGGGGEDLHPTARYCDCTYWNPKISPVKTSSLCSLI